MTIWIVSYIKSVEIDECQVFSRFAITEGGDN